MSRLQNRPTLRVDIDQPLSFTYKKKTFSGFKGDTVASALFSGGIRIFSRSLKYHRPRGLYSLDGECSNTCMEVNDIPNVNTEKTLLKNGMRVKAQNVKGSPELDAMSFMDSLDRVMPAGFYYRTMHKPARLWPIALRQVRKAAGLGRISPDFRMAGEFDEIFPSTDVCVIGGGPSGMAAAIAAAENGLRVILLEARPWLGGYYDYRQSEFSQGLPHYQRARDLATRLLSLPNIRVFTHTAMVGAYSNNLVTAFQTGGETDPFDERYIEIRAHSTVVATGCIERPLLFENNERPGIMQIGCAHRLANTYGILPGRRAVFSIAHDLGIEAAIDLCDAGLDIAAVADIREAPCQASLVSELAQRDIPYLRGWVAKEAHGSPVKGVSLTTLQGTFDKKLDCDLLVASAGMTPLTGPLSLARAELTFDRHTGFFCPPACLGACMRQDAF
jgi:sarcosine oxidase subunit alpha